MVPKEDKVWSGREEEGKPVWALPASSLLGSARWDGQFYRPTAEAKLGEPGGSSLERAGHAWGGGGTEAAGGLVLARRNERMLGRSSGMWQEAGAGGMEEG